MKGNEQWMHDRIETVDQLRELIEQPHERIEKKTVNIIDSHIEHYLSLSSLFFIATSSADRFTDVSPRGDSPGFVRVLDKKRLVFPDRPGNRRADSLCNMIENPQIGMVFVIPGMDYVLRINGRAVITRNQAFIESMNWEGKTTGLAVVVEVEECFIHCPRAFKQSGLWNKEEWISEELQPSTTEMYKAHLALNGVKLAD